MTSSLDILYLACTQPFGCGEVFFTLAVASDLGAEERLEFVRLWARATGLTALTPPQPPPTTLPIDHTRDLWLQYGLVDKAWAAVAVHAEAIARVSTFHTKVIPCTQFPVKLSRFLKNYSKGATLGSAGPSYLSNYARTIAPGHCTALSGNMPFAEVASAVQEDMNAMMGPVISETVSTQTDQIRWTTYSSKDMLLSAALLSDATGSVPVYVNSDILKATPETPAIFVFHDFGRPDCYGIIYNKILHVASTDSVTPTLDTLAMYIHVSGSELYDTFTKGTLAPIRLQKYFN